MKNSVYFLLFTLLKREGYRVNSTELEFQLLSHPSYPSLHSLTGVLNHFSFDNTALKLPCTLEILNELPKNFIALSKENKYLLIKKIENRIYLTSEEGVSKEITSKEFIDIWDGIVLGMEPSVNQKNNSLTSSSIHRKFSPLIIALIIIAQFISEGPSNFMLSHFLLSLIGLSISLLIVQHESGYHSKVLEDICNSNKSTNCDKVLTSKASKLFGVIRLSDLSMVYFMGMIISWSLLSIFDVNHYLIKGITLVSILAAMFSIYYQYFVVKKWCPLCLGIAAVLLFQASSLLLSDYIHLSFQINELAVLAFSFMISTALWIYRRSLLEENQELKKIKNDYFRFKKNINVFLALCNRTEKINTSVSQIEDTEIILGDKSSSVEVLLLTNPLCFYCKSAHKDIRKIIAKYSSKVRVVIRFNTNADDLENIGVKVSSRLLEIFKQENLKILEQALHEAYAENVNLEAWLTKWGECSNLNFYNQILKEQQNWCNNKDIYFTPALLLNGRILPEEYNRDDLMFFIDDLYELTASRKEDAEVDFA